MPLTWMDAGDYIPWHEGEVTPDDVSVIVGLMNEWASEDHGCMECVYCCDQSDGPEYGPEFYGCEKPGRERLSNLKYFPFKRAPACYVADFWNCPVCILINGEDDSNQERWALRLFRVSDVRGAISLNPRNQKRVAEALERFKAAREASHA